MNTKLSLKKLPDIPLDCICLQITVVLMFQPDM